MRIAGFFLSLALIAFSVTACTQKSSTSTSTTSSAATAAATEAGAASSATNAPESAATNAPATNAPAGAAASTEVPIYPGATVKHNTSTQTAAGMTVTTKQTALTTTDSFEKVDAWYKDKLTGWTNLGVNKAASNGQIQAETDAFKNGNYTVGITYVGPNETWVSILETTQGQ